MNGDNKAPISCWYSYAQYCEVVSATMNTFFKTVNIIADVFIFFQKNKYIPTYVVHNFEKKNSSSFLTLRQKILLVHMY